LLHTDIWGYAWVNPHLHILTADGGFNDNGIFYAAAIELDAESLEPLFRHKILSMLKKRGADYRQGNRAYFKLGSSRI